MDEDSGDQQPSTEVTPASSENDLLANKSEDSVDDDDDDEDEDEDDDDIDKMLSELQSFQEASLFSLLHVAEKTKSISIHLVHVHRCGHISWGP